MNDNDFWISVWKNDNDFWISVWKIVALVACVGIAVTGGCTAYESSRVADAVAAGADPIAARCGIVGNTGDSRNPMCILAASQKKETEK